MEIGQLGFEKFFRLGDRNYPSLGEQFTERGDPRVSGL